MKSNIIKKIKIKNPQCLHLGVFLSNKNWQSNSPRSSWLLALQASLHPSRNLANSLSSLPEFVSHSFHQFSFPLKNRSPIACYFSLFHSFPFIFASCSQFSYLSLHFFLPKTPSLISQKPLEGKK